jgi:sugar phosphate isomerase/epimerase
VDILADIGNCHFVDEDISGIVGALFERIKHVHIKDYRVTGAPIANQRSCKTQNGRYLTDCEIGVGDIGVSDAIATLEGAGYKGMYSLEFAKLSSDDEPLRVIERLTGSDRVLEET